MKKVLWAALAVAGLTAACDRDDEVQLAQRLAPASVADLTKRFAPPTQVFEFDPTQAQTIRTAGGATITVSANAFVRADGTPPTGPVRLLFQEIYAPADMLLADMPTQSTQGYPLESGGEFNIRVLEGPQRLRAYSTGLNVPLIRLTSPQPTRTAAALSSPMLLWSQAGGLPDSAGWVPVRLVRDSIQGVPTTVQVWADSSSATTSYYTNAFWPDTLGWLNYDVYPPAPTRVTVRVATEAAADQRVYLIPTDRNGAFRPYPDAVGGSYRYSFLPAGLELTAVVMYVKDGKYYYGTQRAPAAEGFVYRPTMEEVSEEELVRRIRLL